MEDDPDALAFASATWTELLEPIPDRWLNECFKLAAQDGKQVTPGEMIRAWSTLNSNGTVAASMKALPEGPPCDFCNRTGWVYLDKEGNRLKWLDIAQGIGVRACDHAT